MDPARLQSILASYGSRSQLLTSIRPTFGLVLTILLGIRFARASVAWLVGLYVTGAYWFTASTSFANPAVAIVLQLDPPTPDYLPHGLEGVAADRR